MLKRLWIASLLWVLVTPAGAQNLFTANLNGNQEVPPNASTATGFASAQLLNGEAQLLVKVFFSGLGSPATAAHVHGPGGIGTNAPVVFDLGLSAGPTQGSTEAVLVPISPAQLTDLRAGLHYVNIHSTGFPGGEIRGQLLPSVPILARLDARQEVPPTASTARGNGRVYLNPATNQVIALLSWSDLSGPVTAGHIHVAPLGANGPVVCDLSPPAAANSGIPHTLCTLTAPQFAALRAGDAYFNLHTANFPGGEIRGQIDGLLINGFE